MSAAGVAGALLAWVLGGVPVGFLVARAAGGVDLRRSGSGNIGATNVLRTLGPAAGIATLIGDIAKGYVAASLAGWLGAGAGWQAAGALLAVAGNCWSPFLRFSGGKGVATGLGAFLSLAPWGVLPSALVWIALVASFRYVSLASVLGCLGLPVGVAALGYPWPSVASAAAVAVIIGWRHRENIERLLNGTERRLGQRA